MVCRLPRVSWNVFALGGVEVVSSEDVNFSDEPRYFCSNYAFQAEDQERVFKLSKSSLVEVLGSFETH
jgi:hypothetical protein